MTLLCVPIFVDNVEQARRDALAAAEHGADLIEYRIDRIADEAAVHELLRDPPVPCIATCRPSWEGGHSEQSDLERGMVLMWAADAGAAYVDIELKTLERAPFFTLFDGERSFKAIVSSHDFTGRPARLTNIVHDLNASEGDIVKVVWMARSVRDNLEAFELLQHRQKPTIALCMGEAGLISRVLAKKFGAFLTFASLRDESATAPGQVTIHDMKRLYRWDAIGAGTKVYGVVASPVAHSMSPAVHNAAFEKTGHDGVYLPLLVNAGYESFKAFMESFVPFPGLDLSGLSVTLPHKENALRYLQEKDAEVEELAARIGAVNTIVIDHSGGEPKLAGRNTDYAAILDSITDKMGITREDLKDLRVAVIGAGGTGRTAVAALAHYGATVVVYNRTRDKADALAAEFNGKTGKVVAAPVDKLCDSCCHVFINTTSVGMHPNVNESPLGERLPEFTPDTVVFDTVYNPMKTKFLQQAEAAGAKTIGGVEMFVRQAAAQFEAWTGKPAPTDAMRQVVEQRLAGTIVPSPATTADPRT
jgi:3-dehydroquinate dehydratase/shikimate dehydrogenase